MKTKTQKMFRSMRMIFVCAIGLLPGFSKGQNGANDSTFNTPDAGVNSIYKGANGTVTNCAVQNNNKKILITGNFTTYNGALANHIARLEANGNRDNTFNTGTGLNGTAMTLIVSPDNKIILGGSFTQYNNKPVSNIVRLNANGNADNTFKNGTGFNGPVACMACKQTEK
jgi:hypothetical protein